VDEYQLCEAKSIGADGIFVDCSSFGTAELKSLAIFAKKFGARGLDGVLMERLDRSLCRCIRLGGSQQSKTKKNFSSILQTS